MRAADLLDCMQSLDQPEQVPERGTDDVESETRRS